MYDYLEQRRQAARHVVDDLPDSKVLSESVEVLAEALMEDLQAHPIVLEEEDLRQDKPREVDLQIPMLPGDLPSRARGTKVAVYLPFAGEAEFFRVIPTQFNYNPPRAEVRGREVLITWEGRPEYADQAKGQVEQSLQALRVWVGWLREDIDRYNLSLRSDVADWLRQRCSHLEQNQLIANVLDIPIRSRPDAARDLVPVPRRRPVAVETKTEARDPKISDADYSALISQLASARGLIERLPETFRPMDEESLRDLLLVILNNQFGIGSAEAFSRSGKTDITIQQDRGPVFIAECKIWSGTKAFGDAIGQLLSYLVWRDTKAALVLFVHEKDVTGITEKAVAAVAVHPQVVRQGESIGDVPTFILHHEGDNRRHVRIALLVIAVPAT